MLLWCIAILMGLIQAALLYYVLPLVEKGGRSTLNRYGGFVAILYYFLVHLPFIALVMCGVFVAAFVPDQFRSSSEPNFAAMVSVQSLFCLAALFFTIKKNPKLFK